ncbi:hypothetical protein SAMN05216376_105207 [Mameliella alba]|nr:hypothetical protein CDZ96_10595 [Mameliella alba]PTR40298.1 hypothetical protein LX94_01780 [Mameliella alba]GGF43864.1 hypothetical protein GCM10011319_02080 [Mameliella alba]SDC98607.1 hypothetical protein SAMN05216376_105207 [Mameliella alba]
MICPPITHGKPALGHGAGQQAGGVQTSPRAVSGLRNQIPSRAVVAGAWWEATAGAGSGGPQTRRKVTSLRASVVMGARHLPRRFLMAAGAFLLLATGVAAQAVQGCAERDRIMVDLAEGFGQRRVAVMLSQGSVVEIYAHPELGEWTALRVGPDGLACVIDFGEVFFAVDDRPPEGDPL